MPQVIDAFHYVNAGAALGLAIVAGVQAGRGGRPSRWGAVAFAALAVALLISALDGRDGSDGLRKALLCLLLVFPYALLRFTASFGAVPAGFTRVAGAATAGVLAATLLVPVLPRHDAVRPGWVTAYLVVVLAFFTALSLATVAGLWRSGSGQPTLACRRARLMAGGTVVINVLMVLAAIGAPAGWGRLAVHVLLLGALVAFAVGFAPPPFVRLAWRKPEQDRLRRATEELVRARTVSEVTATLLPHVARIVGGSGAEISDEHGDVVARVGSLPDGDGDRGRDARVVLPLSPPFGALSVATGPLTPFFGREELGLLQGIAVLADLSLTRCVVSEREREAQAALHAAVTQVAKASAAKSEFVSRMSHELRTPLNVVLGFAQVLEMRGSLATKDHEAVEQILKAGRHLLELINEVLDLSRIESGRMTMSAEAVEVADIAREAMDLIAPLAQERGVRLDADLGRGHCHVTADRQRLKQVLLNLLSNGVKYNREGGEVTLSCVDGGEGRLRLCVADTGRGIPASLMDRLFEPFERLGADGGAVEGTGLGLALSQELVTLMGGTIGADSRDGEGSTFWVELAVADPPRVTVAVPPAEEPAPVLLAARRRRVLLIEDNLANVKLIQVLTAERPHIELRTALTGGRGLELALEHPLDLILLDQHLPDVSGAQVLQRLKAGAETRDIPVVIVTADATPDQMERMRERGAAGYLTKPLDIPRFMQVIEGVLEPPPAETVSP
jgi:signal transduction histidine kinase/CheY-like chemotaxis protein